MFLTNSVKQMANLDQIITIKRPNLDQIITIKKAKLGPDNNSTAYMYIYMCAYIYIHTVGTKIIADPENCFQELCSEKMLILLRERPCPEVFIVSSNFQASFFLQDKLLKSVYKKKKETKTRNQKKAQKKDKKEGRKKRKIERERERYRERECEKGGGQKRLRRNKRRH